MRSSNALLAVVSMAAVLSACAEAGGEVRGGDLTDAGAGAVTPPTFEANSICFGSGTKWSDLYRDIFGPTGRPGSCSFRSNCHGTADGDGAKSGSGIQCYDEKGCRQSLFDKHIITPEDSAAPEKSGIFVGLLRIRKPDGSGKTTGFMPQQPSDYVFPDECVERIKTWIRDGAKDD